MSNQAIGQELWVTEQTVKFHLTNVYRKLGVANRTEAARHAYQHGLVESPVYERSHDAASSTARRTSPPRVSTFGRSRLAYLRRPTVPAP